MRIDKELIIVIVFFAVLYGTARFGSAKTNSDYDRYIDKYTRLYNVDPALVKALIMAESSWNPQAIKYEYSGKVSVGLGQILFPDTARALGYAGNQGGLYDPETNIMLMCKLINDIKKRYSSLSDIVSSYNSGRIEYVNGLYSNQEYVNRVLRYYYQYR